MKCLGLILMTVVTLVAGQVLDERINETDRQLVDHVARAFGQQFHDFLENLRITIREGNETLGVPPLDPFYGESVPFETHGNILQGKGELADLYVHGLSGYKIDKADLSVLNVNLGLTWPEISSKGRHQFDFTFNEMTAYGEGEYTLNVTNLSFSTTAKLKIIGGVSIKKMDTTFSLGGIELVATGILDDEDISKTISEVISEMGPQLVQDYQKEITTMFNEKVMTTVNSYLAGKSLSEIISMLS